MTIEQLLLISGLLTSLLMALACVLYMRDDISDTALQLWVLIPLALGYSISSLVFYCSIFWYSYKLVIDI